MNALCGIRSRLTVWVVLLALFTAAPKCGNGQSDAAADDSQIDRPANNKFALLVKETGLFVSNDAERVAWQANAGEWLRVSFVLHESYPGRQVISAIRSHLTNGGWTPLKENSLNAGMSSSPAMGWSQCVDETGGKLRDYWIWKAAWQDANGDLIEYSLRYSRPFRSKVGLGDVSISGHWMSAAKLQADRELAKRARDNAARSGPR
jgi:hypothetical protein